MSILVFFLTNDKRFHHINWISVLKPQTAKGIFTLQFNFPADFQKINAERPFTPSYLELCLSSMWPKCSWKWNPFLVALYFIWWFEKSYDRQVKKKGYQIKNIDRDRKTHFYFKTWRKALCKIYIQCNVQKEISIVPLNTYIYSLIWLHIVCFKCHQNAKLDYKSNISNDIVNKLSLPWTVGLSHRRIILADHRGKG